MSPWGGYAGREDRINAARREGFEVLGEGEKATFVFHGQRYYQRFRETVFDLMDKYGVSLFKFDGIGSMTGT